MGWFSPSHCVDFCHSFFSNSMYRVTAREGTLLVMLRSKRGTEGSFAPLPHAFCQCKPSASIFEQRMARSPHTTPLLLETRERGSQCQRPPSVSLFERQRAFHAHTTPPSLQTRDKGLVLPKPVFRPNFRATEDFLTATLPLPPLETRDRGLVVPSISIFEQWRACSPIPCSNLAQTVRQRVCSANAYPLS